MYLINDRFVEHNEEFHFDVDVREAQTQNMTNSKHKNKEFSV